LHCSHNKGSQFWFQWKIRSKWSDLIGWGQLQFFYQNFFIGWKNLKNSYLTCDKNLFFCNFFGALLWCTSNIWYDKRQDRGREHNISSLFKSHTKLNQPQLKKKVTSDTAFTMSSPRTRKNINWHHSWLDFLSEKSLEWGSQLLQKCWDLISWKISIFWLDFPSESKLTTLNVPYPSPEASPPP
jgi:hypothetical protein